MSILSDIWAGVRTTLAGLKVTVPYIWRKPVTTMYPHQRLDLPERTRNRLYVNMDDCIGCDKCARACPVDCIDIETVKAVEGDSPGLTSDGRKKALWVTRFDIDIAKCCYCGLCTYPCPTECIEMTDVFEFAEQERNNLIYSYITLTPEEIREKIAAAEADAAAQAARKAAAKAAAVASAPAPSSAPQAPVAPPPGTDPEKVAKIAELQARMAAAKAKREADAAPVAPVTPVDEAAPLLPVPPVEPGSPVAPIEPAPPSAPASAGSEPLSDEDAAKAARIAAMKEKIEALKRQRGEQ